ncbi:unnamed protein product [Psylliodes chrysocephalus]|uniref:Cytochrome P450 n=1 Tax=Psylliodes chrysocephalus TaxID=3402493 RepID=A0A9P0CJ85_9CUCU|nr:unnamed protein product [Psylliodes chrysocephala]
MASMLSLLLVIILLPLLIFYYKRRQKRNEEFWKYIMRIPGPKAYPVIGCAYKVYTTETLWDKERERAKEFFPIYKIWSLDFAAVYNMCPEDIEPVLSNTKHNTKGFVYDFLHAWLGTGLLTSEGTKWHKRRKILTPAFHFNILQEFTDMLNRETQILVENFKKLCHQPYVNVITPITEFTLYSIGETSLGVPLREDPNCTEYKKAVYDYGESFIYRLVRPWLYIPFVYKLSAAYKKNIKTVKTLSDFSTNVIKEKKKIFEKDASYSQRKRLALLDLMLKAQQEGAGIDDEGIREELDTFIFEGHDTTSVSICYTLMVLANNKDTQKEIYQEIISTIGDTQLPSYSDLLELKFMERCIKESLRLYPSVPQIVRVIGEEIKTHSGYTLPKGSNIIIPIYDLHRNPVVWENPEKFDPDRFLPDNIAKRHPFAYIPFSAGSRNCIGQKFAMMEIKAVLCGILRHFKLEPYDKPEYLKHKSDLVLRPAGEIRVNFVPRK